MTQTTVRARQRRWTTLRSRTLAGGVLFVAGFSAVFTSYGVLFGALGSLLIRHQALLTQILGVLTIILGLTFTGLPRKAARIVVESSRSPTAGLPTQARQSAEKLVLLDLPRCVPAPEELLSCGGSNGRTGVARTRTPDQPHGPCDRQSQQGQRHQAPQDHPAHHERSRSVSHAAHSLRPYLLSCPD